MNILNSFSKFLTHFVKRKKSLTSRCHVLIISFMNLVISCFNIFIKTHKFFTRLLLWVPHWMQENSSNILIVLHSSQYPEEHSQWRFSTLQSQNETTWKLPSELSCRFICAKKMRAMYYFFSLDRKFVHTNVYCIFKSFLAFQHFFITFYVLW